MFNSAQVGTRGLGGILRFSLPSMNRLNHLSLQHFQIFYFRRSLGIPFFAGSDTFVDILFDFLRFFII
jgi:hypothetical protein